MKKRGQVTIFMIIGLIVLFVFGFMFLLTSNIQKGQLEDQKESLISKSFRKEALRVFVQDCLYDELEMGLIQIGKTGRIFDDQPGGTLPPIIGQNAALFAQNGELTPIFAAINHQPFQEFPQAWPCSNQNDPHNFCNYTHPDNTKRLGTSRLSTTSIEGDLAQFLANRTQFCVENYTKTNISSQAKVEPAQLLLELSMLDDGLDIRAEYPLTISLGNEEFFHLSEFSFFYPTPFKRFFEAAVKRPLLFDTTYPDFTYNQETLEQPFFSYQNKDPSANCEQNPDGTQTCQLRLQANQYNALQTQLTITPNPETGEDLFTFTLPQATILQTPLPYTYSFVRQNRPPLLNYISNQACPQNGYDYLIILDEENLNTLQFTPFALDADEDTVTYSFAGDSPLAQEIILANPEPTQEPPPINFQLTSQTHQPGIYNVDVVATDEHSLADFQTLRVLVDRPLKTGLNPFLPYTFLDNEGNLVTYDQYLELLPENTVITSIEDPLFVQITVPDQSEQATNPHVTLTYQDENTALIERTIPLAAINEDSQVCYSFPSLSRPPNEQAKACLFGAYSTDDLLRWPAEMFTQPTTTGVLALSHAATYCQDLEMPSSDEKDVIVTQCIPHYNPDVPYPIWGALLTPDQFQISPFEATHSCCLGDLNPQSWRKATAQDQVECFRSPQPGCYGVNPATQHNKGLVLEQQVQFCGDDGPSFACTGQVQSQFPNNELRCARGNEPECNANAIANSCLGNLAYTSLDSNNDNRIDGMCLGELGCSQFCTEAIVYTQADNRRLFNQLQRNQEAIQTGTLPLECGCSRRNGKPCDSDFDGIFEGTCDAGVCDLQV